MVGVATAVASGAAAGGTCGGCMVWASHYIDRLRGQGTSLAKWPPDVAPLRQAATRWPKPPGGRSQGSPEVPSRSPSIISSFSSQFFPPSSAPPVAGTRLEPASGSGPSAGSFYALRFGPGTELNGALRRFVQQQGFKAVGIVTCVGSLTSATLRMANADKDRPNESVRFQERFEIVSLVGTVEASESADADKASGHLHIALSDKDGRVVGGHVVDNCIVFTTAEVVLVVLPNVRFKREPDDVTGFNELAVSTR
eukprot:TRINITY_DN14558_c0_g1_i1.p1 TRINITY_DN14558_c0_g1~~TRINITY_DN14558_c0_g1_i1.p1  ORF type:complete len:254 (-),score=33.88 TRINITY_DN14558_c0_g1_i1:404-1165(-)